MHRTFQTLILMTAILTSFSTFADPHTGYIKVFYEEPTNFVIPMNQDDLEDAPVFLAGDEPQGVVGEREIDHLECVTVDGKTLSVTKEQIEKGEVPAEFIDCLEAAGEDEQDYGISQWAETGSEEQFSFKRKLKNSKTLKQLQKAVPIINQWQWIDLMIDRF
ncbi:MAG: hypothetical protein CL678_19000 [Bdellovibrionaceae bacterium]|nr:hypothetical protein [Pseudobdellovibrionaceae bacterium]|tara:strand:+ start:623 stop:1108 length:486 start_codon:yes stop_codon:yes gene_type:complete